MGTLDRQLIAKRDTMTHTDWITWEQFTQDQDWSGFNADQVSTLIAYSEQNACDVSAENQLDVMKDTLSMYLDGSLDLPL